MHTQRERLHHLPQPARQVLAELELVSHGKAAAWNSSGHGESQAVLPHGESRPPHLHWRALFLAATREQLPALIRQARDEHAAITKGKPRSAASVSVEALVIEHGKGWEPEPVGQRYGITAAHVRRIRTRAGACPETGETTDRGLQALTLADQGLTQNEIAARMGISQPTVNRLLKTARARHQQQAA